jgi:hypothetical protein
LTHKTNRRGGPPISLKKGTRFDWIWHDDFWKFLFPGVKKGSDLNRKVLADLAMNEPATFKALVQSVKG